MSHPHPELTAPEPLPEGALRVTPFGGLGEVGRNMTAFEHAEELQAPLGGGGAVVGDAHDGFEGRQEPLVGRQCGGVVATEEWKSNASARWFSLEPEAAWEQAVQLLEDMADTPVEIDAEAWTATALVNPHQYKLSVTETPTGGSRVSMAVRTYALWDRQESEAWLARYTKRLAALD